MYSFTTEDAHMHEPAAVRRVNTASASPGGRANLEVVMVVVAA